MKQAAPHYASSRLPTLIQRLSGCRVVNPFVVLQDLILDSIQKHTEVGVPFKKEKVRVATGPCQSSVCNSRLFDAPMQAASTSQGGGRCGKCSSKVRYVDVFFYVQGKVYLGTWVHALMCDDLYPGDGDGPCKI